MPTKKRTQWIPMEQTEDYARVLEKEAKAAEEARKKEEEEKKRRVAEYNAAWDAKLAPAPKLQAEWRKAPEWRRREIESAVILGGRSRGGSF